MKVNEALTQTDRLKPNTYGEEQKLIWLSNVEGMVVNEILKYYSKDEIDFDGYVKDDKDEDLLVPDPYSDLYVKYLCSCIDFYNAEMGRYNNSMIMFNTAWQSYADSVSRDNIVTHENKIKIR